MKIRSKIIYEEDLPVGIKFNFGDPICENCKTTEMENPYYALMKDTEIAVCSRACGTALAMSLGYTYDFDCECNTTSPCNMKCDKE